MRDTSRWKFGPLDSPPSWKSFFAFDTETRPDANGNDKFVLGCIFDGEDFHLFYDRTKMIRFMGRKKYTGWTGWATNLEYDLNAVFEEPTWPLFYNYFGGLLKSAKLLLRARTRKGKDGNSVDSNDWLHFADTLNHWPGGVPKYGELLDLKKFDMPIIVPGRELETYVMRDAEITYRMVEYAQRFYNRLGCEMKSSAAASSLDLFRRQHMAEDHAFWPLNKRNRDIFRAAYRGARTENMRKGTFHDVYLADVVSMYPYVMRSLKMPVFDAGFRKTKRMMDGKEGVACATVRVKKGEYYPPLPFRYDKLYFPVGKWTSMFTFNEIRYAEANGVEILKIHFAVNFNESDYVFRDYVDTLFPLKADAARRADAGVKGADLEERMFKLFLNSLYGKFATGGEALSICPSWYDGADLKKDVELFDLGGYRCHRSQIEFPRYTNYVWSAYVTSEARNILHGYLVKYGGFYCDTDSVATFKRIRKNSALGGLDLKYFTKNFEVLAPKVYRDDKNVKIKGVPKDSLAIVRQLTDDGMSLRSIPLRDLTSLVDTYFFQRVTRLRESLRRRTVKNTWDWVDKTLHFEGDKRHFMKNGDSYPLDVSEITSKPLSQSMKNRILPSFKVRQTNIRLVG